jgi:nucleoside-diphosphate-sugar epimerase
LSAVHVDDVVDGIRRVGDEGRAGQRYILSGENVTFPELARTVCQIFGPRKKIISVPGAISDLAGLLLNAVARKRGGTHGARVSPAAFCRNRRGLPRLRHTAENSKAVIFCIAFRPAPSRCVTTLQRSRARRGKVAEFVYGGAPGPFGLRPGPPS